MKILLLNDEFKNRISRIKSRITDELLKNKISLDESEKGYINYIGVSRDNPNFISYLDQKRILIFDNAPISLVTDFSAPFKASLTSSIIERIIHWESYSNQKEFRSQANHTLSFDKGLPIKIKKENFSLEKFNNEISKFPNLEELLINISSDELTFVQYFLSIRNHILKILPVFKPSDISPHWEPDNRLHANVGKVIKKLLTNKMYFSDKELEYFVSNFKIEGTRETGGTGEYLYEEMVGERIRWGYHNKNYIEQKGELRTSCMKYNDCQAYFDIYVENKNHISLGVLMQNNKVAARCILWYPLGKKNQDIKYYDRIYAVNQNAFIELKVFLEKLGYVDCYDDDELEIKINLDYEFKEKQQYPYMDTMCFIRGNVLTNYDPQLSGTHILTSSSGYYSSSNIEPCGRCGLNY